MTSDELEQYQAFEDMVIAMIGLNMSYQEIKAMAFRNKKHAKEARESNKKAYRDQSAEPFTLTLKRI